MKKWYESDEPTEQPLVVALPSKVQAALGVMDAADVKFRKALADEIESAYRAFSEPRRVLR